LVDKLSQSLIVRRNYIALGPNTPVIPPVFVEGEPQVGRNLRFAIWPFR